MPPPPDTATIEQLTRDEYAKAPTLSPFSRRPIPYELAVHLGTHSAAHAETRALERLLAQARA